MSLPPRFASHKLGSTSTNTNVIDIFLDYDCPFSAKLFFKINPILKELQSNPSTKDKPVTFIFRNVPQPWHPVSTILHEAALASEQLASDEFWNISKVLFEHQREYFDSLTLNKTIGEIYESLSELISQNIPSIKRNDLLDLLYIKQTGKGQAATNAGNKTTVDLKYFVKYARQNGIHVTPTVAINGIVENSIGSGNEKEDWVELISKL